MILLDTDHLTVLKYPENPQCLHLKARMATSIDPVFALTIVTAEEQLRGWLAEINRQRTPRQQIPAYLRLRRLRIGSMDLKIGCIALVHNVLLLSANLRDFEQVPNLHVENWLKE
jgi:tRNA(fMet)-specific endonuclease VapC